MAEGKPILEVDAALAARALEAGLALHPEFAAHAPRVVRVPVFRGTALKVEYGSAERPEGTAAWDFQNAVIKEYKRLSGER